MSKTIDFPDLDAAIDAEAWQWLQEAAPVYADAVTAEVDAAMSRATSGAIHAPDAAAPRWRCG
jgi:hypothetical protein